jgi:uncharacterized membrane protein
MLVPSLLSMNKDSRRCRRSASAPDYGNISVMNGLLPRTLFAAALAGLGVLTFVYADFALNWQPIPDGIPARQALIYVSAFALVACAATLLVRRAAAIGALLTAAYLALFWIWPQMLQVLPHPESVGRWLGLCETIGVFCGAGLLWSDSTANGTGFAFFSRLFGACCIVYGVSHFVYAQFTAAMVPAWLPQRLWLAYGTGALHVIAGVFLMIGWRARVAAALESLMMLSFVLLVHIPSVWMRPPPAWAPNLRTELTPLFWASALAATPMLIALCLKTPVRSGRSRRI